MRDTHLNFQLRIPTRRRKFPQFSVFFAKLILSLSLSTHIFMYEWTLLLVLFGISTMNDANHISDVSIKRENEKIGNAKEKITMLSNNDA